MRLCVEAWRVREAARAALAASEFGRAAAQAQRAQQVHWTEAGKALLAVSQVLMAAWGPPPIYQ